MDLTVRFQVLKSGNIVDKRFDSYVQCRNFVSRARRSSKILLISYPTFTV